MATLASIKRQIAQLESEAAKITKREIAAAIEKVKEMISTFELSPEQLGFELDSVRAGVPDFAKKAKAGRGAKRSIAGASKYLDPKTGRTWTGLGRAPDWISAAESRDAFLIGAVDGTTSGSSAAAQAKKKAVKKDAVAKAEGAPTAKSTKRAAKRISAKAPAVKVAVPVSKKPASTKTATKQPTAKAGSKKIAPTAGPIAGALPSVE